MNRMEGKETKKELNQWWCMRVILTTKLCNLSKYNQGAAVFTGSEDLIDGTVHHMGNTFKSPFYKELMRLFGL